MVELPQVVPEGGKVKDRAGPDQLGVGLWQGVNGEVRAGLGLGVSGYGWGYAQGYGFDRVVLMVGVEFSFGLGLGLRGRGKAWVG